MGDYDEYEDEYVMEGEVEEDYEYEYVDLQKDSDGDGLRWSSNIWHGNQSILILNVLENVMAFISTALRAVL